MEWIAACDTPSVGAAVAMLLICLGGMVSYIPQYISMIRARSGDGVSEKSLFALNLSGASVALNALILNWWRFDCFSNSDCSRWACMAGLLGVAQITINWITVMPLWFIFLRFKRNNSTRGFIYDLGYLITFLVVAIIALIVSLVEQSRQNTEFFAIFARILGVLGAVVGALVWIPQIVKLIRTRNPSGLSLLMFLVQIPGSLIIIIFQAVFYHQNWTTWISYVFMCAEQLAIAIILVLYRIRGYHDLIEIAVDDELVDD